MDAVEKIAAAVLYEGYVLWPYRRSAHKNQQRWTIGGVYPRGHSAACNDSDPCFNQTQCLVIGVAPTVRIKIRFLHVVARNVARQSTDSTREFVDELQIGEEKFLSWEEAAEREILVDDLRLAELKEPRRVAIEIPAGSSEELLRGEDGEVAGVLVRSWRALCGEVAIEAESLQENLFRLTVRISNTTAWNHEARRETLQKTLVSAHTIFTVENGAFVSLMDTPDEFKAAAQSCKNIKTWPVLAGEAGDRSTLLSSPIILYDYPQIAPESGGDFFDGAEIDQLLLLNVLTLTDAEKAEMRASDPRAREILERSEALTAEDFMSMHGTIRDFRVLQPDVPPADSSGPFQNSFQNPFSFLETPAPQSVCVGGVELKKGSRVRLRPRAGGDIMDVVLAGKVGIIEAIEQDYEERIHFAVVIEDDP
jgi:hypothetical protein